MKNRNLLLVLLLTIVSCKLPKKTLSKQELLKVEIELFFKEIRDNIDSRNLDYFESYFYENPREYSMEATESLKNKRCVMNFCLFE